MHHTETNSSARREAAIVAKAAVPAALETWAADILAEARVRAQREGLAYAGQVSPDEAWQLHSRGAAVIVDVRTDEERRFVGHVADTAHVPWATGSGMARNPRFLSDLEAVAPKDAVVLLLCRSGKRSHAAAEVAARAGYRQVLNITEGFEGDLDEAYHRNAINGWRVRGLPWTQD